jgi:hypothetical protein
MAAPLLFLSFCFLAAAVVGFSFSVSLFACVDAPCGFDDDCFVFFCASSAAMILRAVLLGFH